MWQGEALARPPPSLSLTPSLSLSLFLSPSLFMYVCMYVYKHWQDPPSLPPCSLPFVHSLFGHCTWLEENLAILWHSDWLWQGEVNQLQVDLKHEQPAGFDAASAATSRCMQPAWRPSGIVTFVWISMDLHRYLKGRLSICDFGYLHIHIWISMYGYPYMDIHRVHGYPCATFRYLYVDIPIKMWISTWISSGISICNI